MVGSALVVSLGGCALDKRPADEGAELPYELSAEECDNLIEIGTEGVKLESVDGPSETQLAKDSVHPEEADLASYRLTFAVEQSFQNLLERRMTIEEISATLSDPEMTTEYEATYDLGGLVELEPHETRRLTFEVVVPANRLSGSYVLGLVQGSALGMTIAPVVRIDVPDSDNCGYPEGMVVQAKQGTVEVQRPVDYGLVGDILDGVLKALLHAAP